MAETYRKEKESTMSKFLRFLHVNPKLIMLKISLFSMYGATSSLLPYLTIHMQSIGLTVEEIAISHLALPFTTFLSAPITGYLVDKFGQYKPVAVLSLILNAVFHHSLLLIPLMETPGQMPPAYVLRHPQKDIVEVWWSPCPSRPCPDDQELDIILAGCVDYCINDQVDASLSIRVVMNPESTDQPLPDSEDDIKLVNNEESQIDTKNIHGILEQNIKNKNKPSKTQKGQDCHKKPCNTVKNQHQALSAFMVLNMHPSLAEAVEDFGVELEPDENEEVTDFRKRFDEELLRSNQVNITALEEADLRCGGLMFTTNLTHNTLKELAADCMLQKCQFRRGGPDICPPDYKESDDRIFWVYFFLRFVSTIMLSGGVMMLDSIALTMIQKFGGEFGRERIFSVFGMAIFSPLTGLLIDQNSQKTGYTNYSAAFYMYDVLLAVSAITILMMPLGVKLPADNIVRDILKIIRLPHVMLFILFLFFLGNFWGFIESYLFLYLKELGASNYLLGVTVTVGTISSLPFLYGAGKITQKFGHINIIIVSFFSHAARLIGYSLIEDPWWCFPFEVIESVAVHLMWIAAATYCMTLAPKSLLATLIGIIGMAHFSLGRGAGSFLGGFLIGTVGSRESFRIMGILAIVAGISYGLPYYFWFRKLENSNKSRSINSECIEGEHLNSEASENTNTRHKDSTISDEHICYMYDMNRKGSSSSSDKRERCNYNKRDSILLMSDTNLNYEAGAKIDLLKSTLELNHNRMLNSQINRQRSFHGQKSKPVSKPMVKSAPAAVNVSEVQKNDTSITDSVNALPSIKLNIPEEHIHLMEESPSRNIETCTDANENISLNGNKTTEN